MGYYGFSTCASIANFGRFDSYIWILTRCSKINYFLKKPDLIKKQINDCNKTLEGIRSKSSSSSEAASILGNYLIT